KSRGRRGRGGRQRVDGAGPGTTPRPSLLGRGRRNQAEAESPEPRPASFPSPPAAIVRTHALACNEATSDPRAKRAGVQPALERTGGRFPALRVSRRGAPTARRFGVLSPARGPSAERPGDTGPRGGEARPDFRTRVHRPGEAAFPGRFGLRP